MAPMIGLVAASLWLLFAGAAAAQTDIKLAHIGERGSLFDRSAQEFARRANDRLRGKATVSVFGASQLGGDAELLRKLKLGTVDLALPSTVMSSYVPAFGLFEMPYLIKDRDHMARVRDRIVMPKLAPEAEKEGFRIIAVWENGFRHITTGKAPVVTPGDLAGLKLRVPQGGWRVKMFEAYGAKPLPLAFSEVYVALKTGAMDGQENPFAQIYPARFYEVQTYLSLSGHVFTPAYLTVGKSWDALGSESRRILTEVAVEMQPVVAKMAAELDDDFLRKLKAAGMRTNEVDKDAFIKASRPIYDEFSQSVPDGKAWIDKAVALGR